MLFLWMSSIFEGNQGLGDSERQFFAVESPLPDVKTLEDCETGDILRNMQC